MVHGLSIPALNMIYMRLGILPLLDDAEQVRRRSVYVATPTNAISTEQGTFIAFNRFDRPEEHEDESQSTNLPCYGTQSFGSTNETVKNGSALTGKQESRLGGNSSSTGSTDLRAASNMD